MKNPTSYILNRDSFSVRDINRIYDTLRRRARAAFTHQWAQITGPTDTFIAKKLKANAEAIEYGLTASYEEAILWTTNTKTSGEFPEDVRENRWMKSQKLIGDSKRLIKNYEAECFQRVRGAKHIKHLSRDRGSTLPNWTSTVQAILTRVRTAYPFVSKKNLHRLGNAIRYLVIGKDAIDTRSGYILARDLLTFGIPAAEIAGPWYDKKKFKSPAEWVKHSTKMESKSFGFFSSMTIRDWIRENGLDDDDRHLRDSVQHYYDREGHAPSVEWARRRSNELEEERAQKEMADQLPRVEEWLEASAYWRRSADYATIDIPKMPDSTFHVLKPGDGEALCRAAKRDGLCVVDTITDLVDDAESRGRGLYEDEDEAFTKKLYKLSEESDVVTLIMSSDPKRRTVVGLNSEGICSSEHHCTGIQNKVDLEAYKYFRVAARAYED
jgi:hypothetical protein